MKAKELAKKLLEHPETEVLIYDSDRLTPGKIISIHEDRLLSWTGTEHPTIDEEILIIKFEHPKSVRRPLKQNSIP